MFVRVIRDSVVFRTRFANLARRTSEGEVCNARATHSTRCKALILERFLRSISGSLFDLPKHSRYEVRVTDPPASR